MAPTAPAPSTAERVRNACAHAEQAVLALPGNDPTPVPVHYLRQCGDVVIAVPDGHRDPEYLARTIADRGVTALHFVPSMLSVFVAEPLASRTDSLRYVFASGEALPAQTVARFHEISSAELHNLYGPTEAAVDVTYYATARGDRTIPIGRPSATTLP